MKMTDEERIDQIRTTLADVQQPSVIRFLLAQYDSLLADKKNLQELLTSADELLEFEGYPIEGKDGEFRRQIAEAIAHSQPEEPK